MKPVLKYALGGAVAAALLWFALRDTDLPSVWAAMKQASVLGLAVAVGCNLVHNVPRVWRWRLLLRPVRRGIAFRPMFTAVIIGYMTTWLIPGRLGEVVRPALLSGKEKVPLGPSVGSILADRLLDGVAIVALFSVAVFVDPLRGEAAQHAATVRATAVGMLAVVGTGLLLLLMLSAFRREVDGWLSRRHRCVAWPGRTALALSRGVESLRDPRRLPMLLLHSLVAWTLIAVGTWFGIRACGAALSLPSVLVLMPLLALGVAVPTPGNVGGYQAMMSLGLGWFSVEPGVAGGAAILMHLVVTVPPIVLGLILLRVERISWGHLMEVGRQVKTLGSGG